MFGTEGFYLWWLIPIVMIGLCFLMARGCCFGRRQRFHDWTGRANQPPSESSLEILGRRYASGEIDDEEYERKRRAITREKEGEAQ